MNNVSGSHLDLLWGATKRVGLLCQLWKPHEQRS